MNAVRLELLLVLELPVQSYVEQVISSGSPHRQHLGPTDIEPTGARVKHRRTHHGASTQRDGSELLLCCSQEASSRLGGDTGLELEEDLG